ncbi:MAG: prephenate dehydrogenase [Flavobacteriaceae bacterium]
MKKKIYMIGVGLIGGSFAIDMRKLFPKSTIIGIDKSEIHLQKALELKLIDETSELSKINNPDIIVISVPVKSILNILPIVLKSVNINSLVIDFGSTKKSICQIVKDHPNRQNFLATHPIAGTEFSGPAAAHDGLFEGKNIIICDKDKTDKSILELGLKIFNLMKMKIGYMDSDSHDKHIAYVSHLSHISSFMLGKTVMDEEKNEKNIFDMAGSGFESTVRLAKSSPEMWTDIFEDNKKNIIKSLDDYIENLAHINSLIKKDKFDEVESQLKSTNYIKTILKGIN